MTPRTEQLADGVTLYLGDCLHVMPHLAECSIDSCVTDPPYGLKFMGKDWDHGVPGVGFWREVLRVLKPGGHLLAFGGTRTYHRLACAIEDAGFEIRDQIQWLYGSGFPKSHDVCKAIDRAAAYAGGHVQNSGKSIGYGGCDPEADRRVVTAPITRAAREWEGWGTALKPACEPIVMARKPLSEKTVVANVLRWGTAALNIDGCRVVCEGGSPSIARRAAGAPASCQPGVYGHTLTNRITPERYEEERPGERLGRWPANVLHDGSAEVMAGFPETTSGALTAEQQANGGWAGTVNCYGTADRGGTNEYAANGGSAARFFYAAKADADDRLGSKHPTVKPVDLIAYLCRLVTPPKGIVLDPFAGTGTTAAACLREGFRCILIEREAEYVADIRRRVAHVSGTDTPLFGKPAKQEALAL